MSMGPAIRKGAVDAILAYVKGVQDEAARRNANGALRLSPVLSSAMRRSAN